MFRNFHHLNRKERYLSIYIYINLYINRCATARPSPASAWKLARRPRQPTRSASLSTTMSRRRSGQQSCRRRRRLGNRDTTHTHTHPFIVFSTYCSSGIGWWSCDENWGHLIITLGTQQSHAAQELTHRLEAIATRVEAIALSLYSKLIESHMESAVSSCLTQASLS